MSKGEDRGSPEASTGSAPAGVTTSVLAAAKLERACRDHTPGLEEERLRLYLDSVEELARDLGAELAALSKKLEAEPDAPSAGTTLVSAALRAADLANLAACAVPELPQGSPIYLQTVATARLASAASRSIVLEHRALASPGDYEALDLRGAEWRAGLAAQQVEDMLQERSETGN